MSKFKTLTLETLKDLDSAKTNAIFNAHLKRCVADCHDRPADEKPRKVVMEVTLTPVLDKVTMDCEEVQVQIHVTDSIPKHRTKVYSMGINRAGALLFNPDSPNNVNQGTLEMAEAEEDDES